MINNNFLWMTGFECSAFPQVGTDELELTQHYRWWASDLERVADVGFKAVRYGIPWHRVNPKPHEYDWSWTDQALDLMQTLGLTPIVDMFHSGTPLWIEGGIMNPIFGEIQGWYAKAFAERYPHVTYYTPTNEPYICAVFGAESGFWYPFLRGPRNAAHAIVNVALGLTRSMNEIRRVRPDAIMMIPDTCEYFHPVDGAFQAEADIYNERRFVIHDLYQGLLTRDKPMWDYLVRYDTEESTLEWFLDNRAKLDVLGLDYYPHSEHQLRRGPKGEMIDETAQQQFGWRAMSRAYSDRYGGVPVFLAETNVGGPVEKRVAWVEDVLEETRKARAEGTPIAGFTYYGAVDHIDWDSMLRSRDYNINPCGMWSLSWQGDKLVRTPTALVDLFRRYISQPAEEVVGPLASPDAAARVQAILSPVEQLAEAAEVRAGRPEARAMVSGRLPLDL